MCAFAIAEAAPNAKKQAKAGKRMPVPTQSKKRIAEIASYLPVEPAASGARISDRKAWERLAELDSAARIIKKAEGIFGIGIDIEPIEIAIGQIEDAFKIISHRRFHDSLKGLPTA